MPKVTPFLMYDDQLEQALDLYPRVFPDVTVEHVRRAGDGGPVLSAEFTVGGQRLMAFNGGDHFSFSDGVSLFVECADQYEVDRIWNALVEAGGREQRCGWIVDPFGLRWQVIPQRLGELLSDPDAAKARAVGEAMMGMIRIDVAALEKAHAEA